MKSNYPTLSPIWRLEMATKNPRTNGQSNTQSGQVITQHGHSQVLARARQIFPLTLFRDHLVVEELRVIWIKKIGPWTSAIVSIMATDIASVNCSTGLFFGHIHIQSLTGGPEILVDNLLRRDVYTIRSLVEGIALSAREGLRVVSGNNLEAERQSLMEAGKIN